MRVLSFRVFNIVFFVLLVAAFFVPIVQVHGVGYNFFQALEHLEDFGIVVIIKIITYPILFYIFAGVLHRSTFRSKEFNDSSILKMDRYFLYLGIIYLMLFDLIPLELPIKFGETLKPSYDLEMAANIHRGLSHDIFIGLFVLLTIVQTCVFMWSKANIQNSEVNTSEDPLPPDSVESQSQRILLELKKSHDDSLLETQKKFQHIVDELDVSIAKIKTQLNSPT